MRLNRLTPTLYYPKIYDTRVSDFLYRFLLITLLAVAFILILIIKSRLDFIKTSLFVLVYANFVTAFALSRLLGAIFYKKSLSAITANINQKRIYSYEPRVTFVIPCKNEEGAIANTVSKCFEADYPKNKVEVIVINDGSTDNTINVLRNLEKKFKSLTVVNWETNRGKRHGMAEGFRQASGEIIIQLDSDSYMEPRNFRKLIEPFVNPRIGAVCAHADPQNANENLITKMQAAYYFMSFRILKAAESTFATVFCCSGCSSAYRKSIISPIMSTWLNEKFLGLPVTWGDDRGLTNWVLKLGYDTIYTDKATAFTIVPKNLKQLFKQQIRWKKGWFVNSIFALKFITKKRPFVALSYFIPLCAVTILTPFMAVKTLVYEPIARGILPIYYFLGVALMASIIILFYRLVNRENKYWPYIFAWTALNTFVLSFVFFYALLRINDRGWGTR